MKKYAVAACVHLNEMRKRGDPDEFTGFFFRIVAPAVIVLLAVLWAFANLPQL